MPWFISFTFKIQNENESTTTQTSLVYYTGLDYYTISTKTDSEMSFSRFKSIKRGIPGSAQTIIEGPKLTGEVEIVDQNSFCQNENRIRVLLELPSRDGQGINMTDIHPRTQGLFFF